MNQEELRKLAIKYVCPFGGEPQTARDIVMVNNLISFGNAVLESHLTMLAPDLPKRDGISKCQKCRRFFCTCGIHPVSAGG